MNVVFLDFDGVCTSYFEEVGSYVTHSPEKYGPSESCIYQLRNLCEDTGAKVIISSNWRKFPENGKCSFWTHPYYQVTVQNPLPKLKQIIGDLIIGTVPIVRHNSKADAIRQWFEQNLVNKDFKYVIFDDDLGEGIQDDKEFKRHFILTDPIVGLTYSDCQKAKQILNRVNLMVKMI